MDTDAWFMIPPYDVQRGTDPTPLEFLIGELKSGAWTHFRAAAAFAKTSGNFPALLDALDTFLEGGGEVSLTFSADEFGGDNYASDFDAVSTLVERFGDRDRFSLNLYREPGRTFHPKLYLFSAPHDDVALVLVGSSNWSGGGLTNNIEANAIVRLDLTDEEQSRAHQNLVEYFNKYWTESE